MVSFIAVIVPYIVTGSIAILAQISYLIYFRGRINGISIVLAKCNCKIIVDFFSIIIIAAVMGTPFMMYIIAAALLAFNKNFEGVYVPMIAAIHLLILAILFWYMRRWRLNLLVKICFTLAVILFSVYLLVAINLNDFFSYSGATAIYLSFSLVMIGRIVYEVDMIKDKVYFNSYLKAMDASDLHDDPKKIVDDAYAKSKKGSYILINVYLNIYLIILTIYAVTIYFQENQQKRGIGGMNCFLIVVTDSIILSTAICTRNPPRPLITTILMLVSRTCVVFLPKYWILMHGFALLVISMFLILRFVLANIKVPSRSSMINRKYK